MTRRIKIMKSRALWNSDLCYWMSAWYCSHKCWNSRLRDHLRELAKAVRQWNFDFVQAARRVRLKMTHSMRGSKRNKSIGSFKVAGLNDYPRDNGGFGHWWLLRKYSCDFAYQLRSGLESLNWRLLRVANLSDYIGDRSKYRAELGIRCQISRHFRQLQKHNESRDSGKAERQARSTSNSDHNRRRG